MERELPAGNVGAIRARSPSHSEGRSLEDLEPDGFRRRGGRGQGGMIREARNALSLLPRTRVSGTFIKDVSFRPVFPLVVCEPVGLSRERTREVFA